MDELTIQSREHMLILQTAFRHVNTGDPALKANLDDKRAPISAFYQDLVNFEDAWFSKIFSPDGDPQHACTAVVTLTHLAEAFSRQRGKTPRCMKIMKHAMQVLECFRVQTYDRVPKLGQFQIKNFWQAAHQTAHQAHGTWNCLNMQMGDKKEAIESCRWLVEHELDKKVVFERRMFLPLIHKCVGPSMPRTLTKEQVRQVDDSDIWQQLKVCLDIAS
jgi:hypothetical protein